MLVAFPMPTARVLAMIVQLAHSSLLAVNLLVTSARKGPQIHLKVKLPAQHAILELTPPPLGVQLATIVALAVSKRSME